MVSSCCKLWLVIWKNLILRKRQYIITAFELLLPTVFILLLLVPLSFISRRTAEAVSGTGNQNWKKQRPTSYKELIDNIPFRGRTFGFVPDDPATTQFIDLLKEKFNADGLAGHQKRNILWKGFSTEKEIESMVEQDELNHVDNKQRLHGAVVFKGLLESPKDYPDNHKISYKIRLIEPENQNREAIAITHHNHEQSGFIGLQIMIDKVLSTLLTKVETSYELSIQPLPVLDDGSKSNYLSIGVSFVLPHFLVLGFIFIIPSTVSKIVSEKQTGIKELMKMSGIPNWMHWVGWMLNSLIVLIFSITVITILLFFKLANGVSVIRYGEPSLWWVVLFLYIIWATSFCFLIASFFERPPLAVTAGLVIWIAVFEGVSVTLIIGEYYKDLSFSNTMLILLCPNMALFYAVQIMTLFESTGVGSHWDNLSEPIDANSLLTLAHVLLMFVVDIILYILLAMYFEKIIPTNFGVRKPWYFLVSPAEWGFGSKKQVSENIADLQQSAVQAEEGDQFEKVLDDLKVGVEILKIRKEFGRRKIAVDDVSLKVYEGQIFCLLGHNGAGKTTLMSILTGLIGPTSGTAFINGQNMKTDMNKIRQSLGLCPQHNLLFDKLTVSEHLTFFGMIKGLSCSQIKMELPSLMRKLQLIQKADQLSSSLSGGQKRKLNLGCAIIGGSKVLFLDECSSGLDPEARRVIWDLLLEIRGERTIILTTHSLEEADVLGDRIAIMAGGKVQCCGSPSYLKKYYGAGYTLTLTLNPGGTPDDVMKSIQSHVPTAFIKSYSEGVEISELSITIPSENNNSANFPNMFSELLAKKEQLMVQDIGIALTTMDEVFIKVDELIHVNDNSSPMKEITDNPNASSNVNLGLPKFNGLNLWMLQFWGLLVKKMMYSFRRRRLFLFQIVFPILLVIFAVLITNGVFSAAGDSDPPEPIKISLSSFHDPVTVYSTTLGTEDLGRFYKDVVGSKSYKYENIFDQLYEVAESDPAIYKQRYIVAAEFTSVSEINAMYSIHTSKRFLHTSPLAVNLITNTMLRYASRKGFSIEVTNYPLSRTSRVKRAIEFLSTDPEKEAFSISIVCGIFFVLAHTILAASFIIFPIEERICQSKQLQLMSGVNPFIFWGSSLFWDYYVMLTCIAIMTACLPIFEAYEAFTSYGGAGVVFIIMAAFAIDAILFSYVFSFFTKTIAGGFSVVTVIHLLIGLSVGPSLQTVERAGVDISTYGGIGRLFPTYGLGKSIMIYVRIVILNSRCNVLTKDIMKSVCGPGNEDYVEVCCSNCTGHKCFKPKPYFVWENKDVPLVNVTTGGTILGSTQGINQEIVYMLLMAGVYAGIMILVESGLVKMLLNMICSQSNWLFTTYSVDSDVIAETDRVKTLIENGQTSEDAVIVDSLCKSYKTFSAVSNLTFGVHYGECFGLLGVNGAGKTTSFRMLTGDEIISSGNAYMHMYSLQTNRKNFLKNIGYCPQFDGIIGCLSGLEMLQLFARLRGIHSSAVTFEAQKLLSRLGLSEDAKVQCQKYSGGMKRRLSAAMAIIGDPAVIFFDEPTSGVDAVSRRQFWTVISSLKDSGQAIVLTSHSMEECEVLCGRLGIMVNGELQCLGGVQHLKNKFALGYSLMIRLKSEALNPRPQEVISQMTDEVQPQEGLQSQNGMNPLVTQSQSQVPQNVNSLPTGNEAQIQGVHQPQPENEFQPQNGMGPMGTEFQAPRHNFPEFQPPVEMPMTEFQIQEAQIKERISVLINEVVTQFNPCSFKEQHLATLQFSIESTAMDWDVLFRTMESIKTQFEDLIEEYSLSQTSLEEVFLSFAKLQFSNTRTIG